MAYKSVDEVVVMLRTLVNDVGVSREKLAAMAYEIGAEDAISTVVRTFREHGLCGGDEKRELN